jgi:hypothetical protein
MATTAYKNCTDAVKPNRNNGERFISNTNRNDNNLRVVDTNAVWFQPRSHLEKADNGGVAEHQTGLSLLELTGAHYSEPSLDDTELRRLFAERLTP